MVYEPDADAFVEATVTHFLPTSFCRLTRAPAAALPDAVTLVPAFFTVKVGAAVVAVACAAVVVGAPTVVVGAAVVVVAPAGRSPLSTSNLPYCPAIRWLPTPHQK